MAVHFGVRLASNACRLAIDAAVATVLRQNTLSLSQFNLAYSFFGYEYA
jgi:hypothetical protein